MIYQFRRCPTNGLLIEWRADQDGARWCFYRTCDSRNDAKRSLALLQGENADLAQMELLEEVAA